MFKYIIKWLLNISIATDQLINSILFGACDESLSARAYRTEQKGKVFGKLFRPLIDILFFIFQRDHCLKAYIAEQKRKQLPIEYQY